VHGEAGLATKAPGRKATDPRDREIERLQKANAKLERRTYVAEQLIELQKKVFHLADTVKPEKDS